MIPTIIKYRKVIAGGALLILLVIGYIYWASYQQGVGEARATHKYNALIDKQKREAAELLARETAKVDKAKKELHDEKNEREVQDARNAKHVANLSTRLRDLTVNGRLRDPNAGRGACSDTTVHGSTPSSSDSPDNGAEASGLLSTELTGLLQQLTGEADEINIAYNSCRQYLGKVREVINAQ